MHKYIYGPTFGRTHEAICRARFAPVNSTNKKLAFYLSLEGTAGISVTLSSGFLNPFYLDKCILQSMSSVKSPYFNIKFSFIVVKKYHNIILFIMILWVNGNTYEVVCKNPPHKAVLMKVAQLCKKDYCKQ